MFNDEELMFFVNSKDIKLEGLESNMAYEMGCDIWDFEWDLSRRHNDDFLIFFKQTGENEFTETFTGTKYFLTELDTIISEDYLVSFSMDKIIYLNNETFEEFKKQCEISFSNKMKRKMKKTYRKNRKAHKKNIEREDEKVLGKKYKTKNKLENSK